MFHVHLVYFTQRVYHIHSLCNILYESEKWFGEKKKSISSNDVLTCSFSYYNGAKNKIKLVNLLSAGTTSKLHWVNDKGLCFQLGI